MWDYCKVTEVPAPSQPNCLRGNDPMQNGNTTLHRGLLGARTSIQGKRTPGLARPLRQRTGFNYIDFVRAGSRLASSVEGLARTDLFGHGRTRLWIGCSDTGSSETTSMRFPTCSVVDRVLARNPETRIFGVTATAARSDGAKDGAHQPPQARSIPQEKRPTESRWPWRNGGGGGNRTRVRKSSALGSTCVASSSI